MRKFLMALMLTLLPILGIASVTPASAAAPGGMTLLDKLATGESMIDSVAYKCRYHCHRVCVKRNYYGHCVYWTRKCHKKCYRVYRSW
jgi:hypothetical protein